jgi:hypothetical protein
MRTEVNRLTWGISISAVVLALLVSAAQAQTNYAVDWWTADGGGGRSTGGVYSVSGTIGQADTGEMSDGAFALSVGFWGVVAAIQTPGAPRLSVVLTNGAVIVSWPGPAEGWVLDEVAVLVAVPRSNAWTQVTIPHSTNATPIQVTVPPPVTGNKFYRLRKLLPVAQALNAMKKHRQQ